MKGGTSRHIEEMISTAAAHQGGYMVEKMKGEQVQIGIAKSRGKRKKTEKYLIERASHPKLNGKSSNLGGI